jgi:hypothetical protein
MLQPSRLGLQAREERAELRSRLAQPDERVAKFGAHLREFGRDPLQRRDRPLCLGGEARGAFALLGLERFRSRGGALGELGDVAKPLPFGEQDSLGVWIQAVRVLDERLQLGEPRLDGGGVSDELVAPTSRRRQLAPRGRERGAAAKLLVAGERVEHVELIGGPREPPLLELTGHADEELGRPGHVLASRRATPGVGPRPAVGEDPAGEDDARLALRPQLRERQALLVEEPVRHVEFGLHVGLVGSGSDRLGIALRAEEEPDCLREDRLAGAGLAGDRVQAGRELELGLADQDQVLDTQTAQHAGDRSEVP